MEQQAHKGRLQQGVRHDAGVGGGDAGARVAGERHGEAGPHREHGVRKVTEQGSVGAVGAGGHDDAQPVAPAPRVEDAGVLHRAHAAREERVAGGGEDEEGGQAPQPGVAKGSVGERGQEGGDPEVGAG